MPAPERLARTVALAVIIAIGIFNLYIAVTNWTLSDAGAYWQAGLRLRLVWRNSIWEGWVQRPAEQTSAIEVAYVESGRLMVRSQARR